MARRTMGVGLTHSTSVEKDLRSRTYPPAAGRICSIADRTMGCSDVIRLGSRVSARACSCMVLGERPGAFGRALNPASERSAI